MPAEEKNIKITRLNQDETLTTLYPITKVANVEGLEEALKKTINPYSNSETYVVGDIVINPNNDGIYRCNTAIATAENWNENHWTLLATKNYNNLTNQPDLSVYVESSEISGVATSGSYADLSNKPVLNTNNATAQTVNANETISGTINLHKIAKTGSYTDLLDKPTIPTVDYPVKDVKVNNVSVVDANDIAQIDLTGYQPLINSSNKLSADLLEDGTTNKVYTATEQTKLSGIEAGAQVNVIEGISVNGTPKQVETGTKIINLTNSDFNLASAMQFIGVSSTDPASSSGATVSGHTTWKKGEVVIYKREIEPGVYEAGYEEYIATENDNAHWELLGDADSYALNSVTVTGTGALGGGGDLTQNRTITHNEVLGEANKKETAAIYKVTIDKYGHIASASGISASDIPNLPASQITSGTLDADRIPTLAQSKITNLTTDLGNKLDKITTGNTNKVYSHNGATQGEIGIDTTTGGTTSSTDLITSGAVNAGLALKQDTLQTQTAYTSKGTSTKVAQITTNTLGQVTGITEVDIAFPSESDITINPTGSGNAITNIEVDSTNKHQLNVTKGNTFLDTASAKVQLSGDVTSGEVSLVNGKATVSTALATIYTDQQHTKTVAGTYTAVQVNDKGLVTAGAINEEVGGKVSDAEYAELPVDEKALYNSTSQGGYHYQVKPHSSLAVGGIFYQEVYVD